MTTVRVALGFSETNFLIPKVIPALLTRRTVSKKRVPQRAVLVLYADLIFHFVYPLRCRSGADMCSKETSWT